MLVMAAGHPVQQLECSLEAQDSERQRGSGEGRDRLEQRRFLVASEPAEPGKSF